MMPGQECHAQWKVRLEELKKELKNMMWQNSIENQRKSFETVERGREKHYNLDYPSKIDELEKEQLVHSSRFYSRKRPRSINLAKMLPYETEGPQEQGHYLSHIVSNLYISIKSLDIQGSLSVKGQDILTLEKEMGMTSFNQGVSAKTVGTVEQLHSCGDDSHNYFAADVDSSSDEDYNDSDFEDENEEEVVTQHIRPPESAATVGVRTWTHELLVWLKMKFDMPIRLRMSLVQVYYALCLTRGQLINLKIYVRVFEILTKDTILLRNEGLTLDWKCLYQEFENLYPVDCFHERLERKDIKLLSRLAEKASYFFNSECLPVIFSKMGSKFSVQNASIVLTSMSMLPSAFNSGGPDSQEDTRHYVASFFYIWSKLSKTYRIDSSITSRLGAIAMNSLLELSNNEEARTYLLVDKYGIYNAEQIQFLFSMLSNSLNILSERFSSFNTKFFHGFASSIIFCIVGQKGMEKDGIIEYLENLVAAVNSYIHPSNSGEWSRSISKMLLSFVYQYHKRYNMEKEPDGELYNLPIEYKLDSLTTKKFVSIFLPAFKIGVQSKKKSVADDYLTSIHLLCHLDSTIVLEHFLLDIYDSLENVTSTHRVTAALRSLEEFARYFASTPTMRVHFTRILLLTLPGLDPNDLDKTMHTLSIFASVANFIPIADLTKGEGNFDLALQFTDDHIEFLKKKLYSDNDKNLESYQIQEDTEIESLKSSTSAFPMIMKSFSERLFILLENIPDPSKSFGIEKDISEMLPKLLSIIFNSLSDEIFSSLFDDVFTFVFENTYHIIADTVAEICGFLIKRKPERFKKVADVLIEKIKDDIEENGAGSSRTGLDLLPGDQPLFWNLVILNECVGNTTSHVLEYGDKIIHFSFYLKDKVKGPAVFASSYLLNQILQSLTKTGLKENLFISPFYEAPLDRGIDFWGGFQFDQERFSAQNLSFIWFIPGLNEISFAIQCFRVHVAKSLKSVADLMKMHTESIKEKRESLVQLMDELRWNFLYLSYALSGISFLLDPYFDILESEVKKDFMEPVHKAVTQWKLGELSENEMQERLEDIVRYLEDESSTVSRAKVFDQSSSRKATNENGKEREPFSAKATQNNPFFTPGEANLFQDCDEGLDVDRVNKVGKRKPYFSNYFFGDELEERRNNKLYVHLNKCHRIIGLSLHLIGNFLMRYFYDNTKLLKHFLYLVNIWFADVGQDRVFGHNHSKSNFGFTRSIQLINRVRKPFTRVAFGGRLEAYHLLRVSLHASSRTQTELDRLLIEDLVILSTSLYSAISKPAQHTLIDCLKKLDGCYGLIIKFAFKHLSKALNENDFKKVENGLEIFGIKRVLRKVQNDYLYLPRYIDLLHRCLQVNNLEVNIISQRLFRCVNTNLKYPSSVCLINDGYIDSIRPPDNYADFEIKLVQLAKGNRRVEYQEKLERLQDLVLSKMKNSNHWKTIFLGLSLLINLQVDLEAKSNEQVIEYLASEASNDHPIVVRTALKGLTKIINKIYFMQLVCYDLNKAFDVDFIPGDLEIRKTLSLSEHSFFDVWRKDIENMENPKFYFDSKFNDGWLFWGENIIVSKKAVSWNLNLNDDASAVLEKFGNMVTKDQLLCIAKLLIAENETASVFQSTDVFFISTLAILISRGIVKKLKFEDILNVISEVYEKDEKSSHIVVCEMITGILMSFKFLTPDLIAIGEEFISRFLSGVFENDLSPENRNVWSIFSWWLPSNIDCRRFVKVTKIFTEVKLDPDSDTALKEATALSYARSILSVLTWSYPKPRSILNLCLENIDHRYQAVREQIGSLMSVLSFTYYYDSVSDSEKFISLCWKDFGVPLYEKKKDSVFFKLIPDIFSQVERWRIEVQNLPPTEMLRTSYIYASITTLIWLRQVLGTSIGYFYQNYVDEYIMPFLIKLINLKEVCQLGNIDPLEIVKKVSQIQYTRSNLEKVIAMLEANYSENLTVMKFKVLSDFTETLYFKNLFNMTSAQKHRIYVITNKLLYDKRTEIRERASSTLTGLIHLSSPADSNEVVDRHAQMYMKTLEEIRRKYKNSRQSFAPSDTVVLHGSTLGLGALVNAFPYESPPPSWVPEILTFLANKASGVSGVVGKTAKDILAKFKKNRQDTWHLDSVVFNESQMQDLEGVLWKSYFV